MPVPDLSRYQKADFQPYPDEFIKIADVMTKVGNAFEFTHFTETNKSIFEMAAHEAFSKIGITIRVNWDEFTDDQGRGLGVYQPGIEPVGRTKRESETDHERIQWGVQRGLDGGPAGTIREDGTIHDPEDKRKKIIT